MRIAAMILGFSVIFGGSTAAAPTPDRALKCPESREFLAPALKTRPGDGDYYKRSQRSIKMKIGDVLTILGGRRKAREIAVLNRNFALKRIDAGAEGAEKRYREDTVLRADALLQILDCLEARKSV